MMSTKVMVVLSNMSQMVLPAAFKSIASMSGIPITDFFIFIIISAIFYMFDILYFTIIHNWFHVFLTFYFNENGLNGKRDKWPDWGPIKNLGPNPEFLTPPLSANIDNSLKPRLPSQQTP